MTGTDFDQRPRFERLVRRVAAEGLEPYGFRKETSRRWTRTAGPDVTHHVEWQKGKWTTSTATSFYVNLDAYWVGGPDMAWPDAPGPLPAHVVGSRLRISVDDPDFDAMTETSGQSGQTRRDLFVLTTEVSEDAAATVLLRLLADQGRPELDRVVDADSCVRALREPDRSIPGAEALMQHFGDLGDPDQVQEQYWRLRRHFAHRDFPRNPRLRAMVAQLHLTEPPSAPDEHGAAGNESPHPV